MTTDGMGMLLNHGRHGTHGMMACFLGRVKFHLSRWDLVFVLKPRMDTDDHGWNGDVVEPRKTWKEAARFRGGRWDSGSGEGVVFETTDEHRWKLRARLGSRNGGARGAVF
jgi:hypothetical protein